MGLLFGRRKEKEEADKRYEMAQGLASDVQSLVDQERERFEALRKKQIDEAVAYQKRSQNMQGGGRRGLMYGGNAQGVM